MADDNTFRQQRRKIEDEPQGDVQNQQNPQQQPENAQNKLDDIRSIQEMASKAEQGGELELKNVPPGFMQGVMKEKQRMEQQQPPPPQRQPIQEEKKTVMYEDDEIKNIRKAGQPVDEDFEALIDGLKHSTQVYEEIQLPSLGRFYDGSDGPMNGVLHIRPMTGEEEQILATQRFIRRGVAMNMIFEQCIRENIRAEKLLSEDRTYLMIYLRGISYTTMYEVQIKCPSCSANFNYTIDLDDLEVRYCHADFDTDKLTDTLPTCGYKFTYRLPNGTDETLLTEHREKRNRSFGDQVLDDTLLYRAAMLLQSVSNGKNTITDKNILLAFLKRLPINDVSYIRSVTSEPPFGIDTNIPVQCSFCTHEFEADLPIEAGFFFPKTHKARK